MENIRIKGFDKNLKCRGMQFEVGKEYKTESTELELCTETVFHYCKTLKQVADYYPVGVENRFCYIEVLGEEIEDGDKCGSNHIKVSREIVGEELDLLLGKINGNTGIWNTGNWNTGDNNTGYSNKGSWNSGDWNPGYKNSGNRNSGNFNSGNFNSGSFNSGNGNSGNGNSGHDNSGRCNSGYDNSGYGNSGNCNSGDRNSGSYNSGDCNSGNFNSCDYSSGFFCAKEPKAIVFDIETDMTVSEFRNSKYYRAMVSSDFILNELKGEKTLKHTYKYACSKWWRGMTPENKEIIKSMPNFDAKIFKEITGITIDELTLSFDATMFQEITGITIKNKKED